MENIFRFAIARPATSVEDALSLARDTPFQEQLRQAHGATNARVAMKRIASGFVAQAGYARSVRALAFGAALEQLSERLAAGEAADELPSVIESIFGMSVTALAGDPRLRDDDERSADSLIAVKLLPEEQAAGVGAGLASALRAISIVRQLAQGDPAIETEDGLARAVRRALALPTGIFPVPVPPRVRTAAPPAADPASAARARVDTLHRAIDELMTVDPADLVSDAGDVVVDREGPSRPSAGQPDSGRLPLLALKPGAAVRLSEPTRQSLAARGIEATERPLDRLVSALQSELDGAARTLASVGKPGAVRSRVGFVGSSAVALQPQPAMFHSGADTSGIPSSYGTIQAVGVADLLVVKQNLKRYDARDVAHIENVLRGESKRREHKRATTTETLSVTETERVREEERETASTERFEMSRAASEVISEQASASAGLTVSGSYGPTVDFEATAQGSIENAKERAVETASQYSREVTERSQTKISEKVRQLRSFRVVTSVEEKNEHGIDNTDGDEHVVGVYQWLEKVYEAQVFNYGLRMIFDFVVPEPAAFAIHALKAGYAEATDVVKPPDFTITPADLTTTNYHGYVTMWEATGIAPPPEAFVTVAKTFRGGPDGPDSQTRGMVVDAAELPLPDGYRAVSGRVVARWGRWDQDNDEVSIRVTVGARAFEYRTGTAARWDFTLDGEVAGLPVAVRTYRTSSFTLTVEVVCQRTFRATEKWQLDTHATLLQAYQQQRTAYEAKLEALRSRNAPEISGRNPAMNREIERRELKRACISILTDQHFDLFDSIEVAPDGIPQPNVAESGVEGPYIRFFEQAFEWQNATYVFYPYYWGRRSTWVERFAYDDVDPLFAQFLRAGAARVVAPVRPGFELAVDHFLATGEIWQGGDLPPVSSDLYVPIVEELAEQLGAPGSEVAQGDPWEVSVPTSLVLLRADGRTPRWRKTETGEWVPEDE